MKKEFLVNILFIVVISCLLTGLIVAIQERDRQLFREDLIWFSRYQIVERMYLNDTSEDVIIQTLLSDVGGDWTKNEIKKDLEIIKSY